MAHETDAATYTPGRMTPSRVVFLLPLSLVKSKTWFTVSTRLLPQACTVFKKDVWFESSGVSDSNSAAAKMPCSGVLRDVSTIRQDLVEACSPQFVRDIRNEIALCLVGQHHSSLENGRQNHHTDRPQEL